MLAHFPSGNSQGRNGSAANVLLNVAVLTRQVGSDERSEEIRASARFMEVVCSSA